MADFDANELNLGLDRFRITDAEKIPAGRYFEQEFYDAEVESLWPHAWQMACRLEMIPNVGDWVEYSNVGKSVIVVRTKEGVKAYHNHCRHRGVPIAGGKGNEHGNCAKSGFICPFHGWRWNLDGECTFVYGRHLFRQDLLDSQELALRSVRCETWGGCAFINLDAQAPALRECLGPVADRLEVHGLANLRAEWWFATVLPANWKTAMEAFHEGYHVMKTHPQLQHAMPAVYNALYGNDTGGQGPAIPPHLTSREYVSELFGHLEHLSEGMAGLCHAKELEIARSLLDVELPENPAEAGDYWWGLVRAEVTRQLREKGENVPDLVAVSGSDPVNALEFIFPHFFILTCLTSMSSYRIRPLGPESCMFEIWSLTNMAPGTESPVPMEPTILPFDSQDFPPIPRQDYSNIPIQQKGLHSGGFEYMRLSGEKEGLISNYQRIIDGYIAGLPGERLAAANRNLGNNFDGPVLDLGIGRTEQGAGHAFYRDHSPRRRSVAGHC